jgi:A/G-specific adenine glycosylase
MTSRIVGMVRSKPSATGRAPAAAELRAVLLEWYRRRPHDYPWRTANPDPYAVLVSEVMLQQTQAARVAPAYRAFLERFPDVGALSSAARAELLRAWGGLGYPRRALALREAARAIVRHHDGRVPSDPAVLRTLPGVGPYTAAAVASIAFGVPVAAVDTNVRRVTARVVHGTDPGGITPRQLQADADAMVDPASPGEWSQALMDLGRFVCRPVPRCGECPLASGCRWNLEGGSPRPAARRQPTFEGSERQARGRVLAVLRERGGATVGELAAETGMPVARTSSAATGLAADGLVSMDGDVTTTEMHVRID